MMSQITYRVHTVGGLRVFFDVLYAKNYIDTHVRYVAINDNAGKPPTFEKALTHRVVKDGIELMLATSFKAAARFAERHKAEVLPILRLFQNY